MNDLRPDSLYFETVTLKDIKPSDLFVVASHVAYRPKFLTTLNLMGVQKDPRAIVLKLAPGDLSFDTRVGTPFGIQKLNALTFYAKGGFNMHVSLLPYNVETVCFISQLFLLNSTVSQALFGPQKF